MLTKSGESMTRIISNSDCFTAIHASPQFHSDVGSVLVSHWPAYSPHLCSSNCVVTVIVKEWITYHGIILFNLPSTSKSVEVTNDAQVRALSENICIITWPWHMYTRLNITARSALSPPCLNTILSQIFSSPTQTSSLLPASTLNSAPLFWNRSVHCFRLAQSVVSIDSCIPFLNNAAYSFEPMVLEWKWCTSVYP